MNLHTALYDKHLAAGAKMVDFAGWSMPLHYGSQVDEHHKVRDDAGMFDVSHMAVVDLNGARVREFLRYLLANDVQRLSQPGKALYSCMLNENGGVIDDLIVYFMSESWFRMVVNAATRAKDLAWLQKHAGVFNVAINERTELAMLAVQGPNARDKVHAVLSQQPALCGSHPPDAVQALQPFFAAELGDCFVARTGYTGEDGYEIMLPGARAPALWDALYGAGVHPVGLGARDTLRLEAGMNLYGQDMDETTTPLESGLSWTVAWQPETRDFIGRAALEKLKAAPSRKLVGLVLKDRGVLRPHQKVIVEGVGEGELTSGSFSPTLGRSIGFARVPASTGQSCFVEIRAKLLAATVVKPPFARLGKSCIEELL